MYVEKLIGVLHIEDTLVVELEHRLKGKARPRFDPRSQRVYMPQDYTTHVHDLQWIFRDCLFRKPNFFSATAPFAIEVCLYRKRAKPKNKKHALTIDTEMPYGSLAPGKPDWDNAAGTVSDAGNGILYRDDAQIVLAVVHRIYAAFNGARMEIFKLKDSVSGAVFVPQGFVDYLKEEKCEES